VKRIKPHQDRGALELIEQAVHLLRTAPAGTLASYYLGALPFVLGLLYFWTDMSRSPFAYDHLAAATLGVAALFLWMKFWQSVFARRLRAMMTGEPPPLLNLRRAIRVFLAQTALQPTGLFLLPLASIPILPFGWVFAFYQSLTVLDDGESTELRSSIKAAGQQAALWPKQNHVLLVVLAGFGFCVFLNWTTLCLGLPVLLKTLLGVESFFSRSALSMLNTTFFAAIFSLTYLSVDPILKAGYALRCFYGQSVRSGEDLKADLRRFSVGGQPAAACLILMFALSASLCASESPPGFGLRQSSGALDLGAARPHRACAVTERGALARSNGRSEHGLRNLRTHRIPRVLLRAKAPRSVTVLRGCARAAPNEKRQATGTVQDAAAATAVQDGSDDTSRITPHASLSPPDLDRTIEHVIQQRKYTWRAPREKMAQSKTTEKGFLAAFLDQIGQMLRDSVKAVFDRLDKLLRKLFQNQRNPRPAASSGYNWILLLEVLLCLLAAAALGALGWLLYRVWRNRRQKAGAIASEPIQLAPDLADENLGAEQLPEDGWTKLARELLERGEFRLAVRAFYFASLAHLSERNLISLAKFKSNRDYERELRRRGHSFPELQALFGENVSVFDRIWYGLHELNADLVARFAANVERLKT
jgi:hypothetical protein